MEDYRLEQSGQEVQNILNGAAMQVDLTAETERATEAEQTLQGKIDTEKGRIDALEEKIPSGASSSNKLATEGYVDDSVATATATFRGTYNLVSDLGLTVDATEQQIATALAGAISTADNNDYAFVQIPTSDETPTEIAEIDRYKFNGTEWAFEYALNNSGFTAAEWAAINSGITSELVTKLGNLPTAAALAEALASKQNVLTFDSVPTQSSNNPVKSGGVYSAINDEKTAREGADSSLSAAIEAILLLIPSAATSLNKLADKAFVNSSIATNTATFRGTFNLVSDLHMTLAATHAQIGNALASAISDEDNNDYCFVQIPTVETAPNEIAQTDRYKFNGSTWEYEYTLNNSGFTSAQWIAINSGITSVLVTKLSALPTNSELTTDLGTLTSAITAINQKIPAAAAQNNKLVDTAALESYIVQVLGVLTVSYNITSTDGHVTFHIEQTDGKITSVALTTSDIASAAALNLKASQADLTALANRVTTAEGNISTLGGRVSTNENDIANLQAAYEALTQSDIIIGALPASGVANKIYRVPGTSSYSDYMWNGTQFVLMATYNNAIDPRPKKGSTNLVESGGVFDNMGALDISELNATENPHTLATYADLSAALAAIPSNDYKKGGMSIKFVQTDDNRYVQYRCVANEFTTDTTKWVIYSESVYVEDPEFIEVKTDKEYKILEATKTDGTKVIGGDLQVNGQIDTLSVTIEHVENPEWLSVITDAEGRVLGGRATDGTVVENCDVEYPNGIPKVIKEYVDDAIPESKNVIENQWKGKNVVVYGDSITAQGNGDYPTTFSYMFWAYRIFEFANMYQRGIGGQTYIWNNLGWYTEPNTNGRYLNRYKFDSQGQETNVVVSPETITQEDINLIESALGKQIEVHYGAFCSWDRITSMIPSSIRETIDLVIICGGVNDFFQYTLQESFAEPIWVPNDDTDPTWVADNTFYKGGDYDITTFSGGIASTIMKMQVWCPNAVVILATPFPCFNMETHQQAKKDIDFRKVSEMEMAIAHYVGAEVIDANGRCGINGVNFPDLVMDGVHPNDVGRKLFGRVFKNEFIRIGTKIQ